MIKPFGIPRLLKGKSGIRNQTEYVLNSILLYDFRTRNHSISRRWCLVISENILLDDLLLVQFPTDISHKFSIKQEVVYWIIYIVKTGKKIVWAITAYLAVSQFRFWFVPRDLHKIYFTDPLLSKPCRTVYALLDRGFSSKINMLLSPNNVFRVVWFNYMVFNSVDEPFLLWNDCSSRQHYQNIHMEPLTFFK